MPINHSRRSWMVASVLGLAAPATFAAPLGFEPWRADFHMHLRSQTAYDTEATMCTSFGKGACHLDTAHQVRGGDDAIAAMDEVGARQGVILSMAYMFGSSYVAGEHYDVARMTRAENEYVAQQVGAHPDRLVGFFGVDPLSSNALDETRYWARDGRLKGLKMHFANSVVNLDDPEQVRKIAAVVGAAGETGLPINIHLSTGKASAPRRRRSSFEKFCRARAMPGCSYVTPPDLVTPMNSCSIISKSSRRISQLMIRLPVM